jgi:hypothetical protein
MELDKVRATTDVYLFRINAFTIPAIELVGVASVEDFFIARQDPESHTVEGLEGSKTAERRVRIRLYRVPAAWNEAGRTTYTK